MEIEFKLVLMLFLGVVVLGSTTFLAIRRQRAKFNLHYGKRFQEIKAKLAEIDQTIATILAKSPDLISVDEIKKQQRKTDNARSALEDLRSQVLLLEASLDKAKADLETRNTKFVTLRKGSIEAKRDVRDLKEERNKMLEDEANFDISHDEAEKTLKLMLEQAGDEYKQSLEKCLQQLEHSKSLLLDTRKIYEQSFKRYIALQSQYQELEKEFHELRDKFQPKQAEAA